MFVLDTNVLSELRDGKPKPSSQVLAWASQQKMSLLFVSATSIFELERGIQLQERKVPAQGQNLRRWLTQLIPQFEGRILPFTHLTAPICARLHIPDPKAYRDSMIAASAIEHGYTVVTRNVQDFKGTGVRLFNPWE